MARKLASIKQITNIFPIEGKDKIVLAEVDGWQVIVQKELYNVGDMCVYCEIDSVLPEKPEFEFLRSKKFRIKTLKLSGTISQGICFPMSILPQYKTYNIGDDVTELIGVKQYEATMDNDKNVESIPTKKYPQFLMKSKLFRKFFLPKKENKGFPSFISKTDETRIQNAPFYLDMDCKFIATEKVDGQSGTFALVRHKSKLPFIKNKFEYIICSRNLRLWKKDNSSYWTVSDKYNMEFVLRNLIGDNDWVAIQGECVASNIQGNKYNVTNPDLYVFNLIYPNGRIDSIKAREICTKNGLKFVPIIDEAVNLKGMTVNEVLDYAHGTSKLYNTLREGVVFRSLDGKQSFKAVDPLFLLKHDE